MFSQLQGQDAKKDKILQWLKENYPDQVAASLSRFGLFNYINDEWKPFKQSASGISNSSNSPPENASKEAANTNKSPHHAILLVHGLDEIGTIWDTLAPKLAGRQEQVLRFEYPNDQSPGDSAELLLACLESAKQAGIQKIFIITHSMGGLVSRDAITSQEFLKAPGHFPAITRLVTVAPPNQGSEFARLRIISETREQLVRLFKRKAELPDALVDGTGQAGPDLIPGSPYLTELNSRKLPSHIPITIIAARMEEKGGIRINKLMQKTKKSYPKLSKHLASVHEC
ncbi:MAG: alpha/beta fold hydrolase, partial [Planctomycetes bacterium]|nr:alpha/beta fold hydrolase [Planctomycetota bacterium]